MERKILRPILAWLVWALLTAPAVGDEPAVGPEETEAYNYIERIGDLAGQIHWCAVKKPINRLIFRSPHAIHVSEMDATFSTTRWRMQAPDQGTNITALREGDTILIEGTFHDHLIDRRLPIDEAPWFQSSSLSLRPFVLSGQTRIEYWTVRPDKLTVYKLVAQKKDIEEIDVAGDQHQAQLIEVRVSGPLSPFWSSRFWFGLDNGLFLRFEGPSGLGEPDRVITYEGTAKPCHSNDEGLGETLP